MTDEKLTPEPEYRLYPIIDKTKIVILGQDPYPGNGRACGCSFWDVTVENSSHKGQKISVDNLVTNLGLKDVDYRTFFKSTARQGVMWLNASFTYESKEAMPKHLKFWKPVVEFIFKQIGPVIYILLGKWAQNIPIPDNGSVILNFPHPSPLNGGYNLYDMTKRLDIAQKKLRQTPIEWYPATQPTPIAPIKKPVVREIPEPIRRAPELLEEEEYEEYEETSEPSEPRPGKGQWDNYVDIDDLC